MPVPTTILIVRHGHVDGISPERFRGRTDLRLTPLGMAQAENVAKRIAAEWAPSVLYSSPLQRCLQTSGPIASACGLDVTVQNSLVDFDFGNLTWKTSDEVGASDPEFYALWMERPQLVRFPGGEALQDVVARCADVLRLVLQRHAGETSVLVTHDSVIRCLLMQILDMPLPAYWRIAQDPCGINEVAIAGTDVRTVRVNCTDGLR